MTTPMSSSPTNLNPESVETFYQYPPPISMSVSPGQDMSTFSPGTFGGTPISGFTPGRPRIFPRAFDFVTFGFIDSIRD